MIKQRAVSAVIWSAVEQIGANGIGTLYMLIFARYLTAEDLGIFAAGTLLIVFASRFAVLGFDSVVVQREDLNETALSTAYWSTLATSVLLAICLSLSANTIAPYFGSPQVAAMIPWLAIGMVIATATSLITALLRRELNMKALARRTLLSNFISGLIAMPLVVSGHGAWGLIAQSVIGSALTFLFTLWLTGWPVKWKYDIKVAREMLQFGVPVLGADLLTNYNRESPKLFVGILLGIEALGIFAMAMRILNLLLQVVGVTISKVTLPIMANVNRTSSERVGEIYLRIVRMAAALIFPAFMLVVSLREPLIAALLGPDWSETAPIVAFLCGAGLLTTLNYLNGSTLVAIGYPEARFWFSLLRAAIGSLLLIVFCPYGVIFAAVAFFIRGIIVEPLQLLFLLKKIERSPLSYLASIYRAAISGLLMSLVASYIYLNFSNTHPLISLAIVGTIAMSVYIAVLFVMDRTIYSELMSMRKTKRTQS